MTRYAWAKWGDVNGFFGLMIDNVAVMMILAGSLSAAGFTPDFVLSRMIPGSALGVLIGDLVYTWMAFRLARRTGRSDVTAMPLGIDTPSTIAVTFLVLIPSFQEGMEKFHDKQLAMEYAWHIGAVLLILAGVFKSLFAPLGNKVREWVPRAGLLGSLAAIAICLIAFMPFVSHIATMPLVGMLALLVILVTLVAHRPLPGHIPGVLAALVLGVGVYYVCLGLQDVVGPMVPAPEKAAEGIHGGFAFFPLIDWGSIWKPVLEKLPIILPFALATIVGGIDCTESAVAAGDEYDTRTILLTEGLASLAAGLCGGVLQNTPYIGHPAYKAMGSRAAYTLATGLFVGVGGLLGLFPLVFNSLPHAAMFPILVYVGLEITAQSFRATPVRHYPALALAILPAAAALGQILVEQIHGPNPPANPIFVPMAQTLRCLYNGFIITSLLWGAALAALIDGRFRGSAVYLLVAAAFALFGVIHSPLPDAPIALPTTVMAQLPEAARYHSPYHWAGAYVLCAVFILLLDMFPAGQGHTEAEYTDERKSKE